MLTIPGLKINKFQDVTIPTGKELFKRFGYNTKKGDYTGDQKAPLGERKVETISRIEKDIIDKD